MLSKEEVVEKVPRVGNVWNGGILCSFPRSLPGSGSKIKVTDDEVPFFAETYDHDFTRIGVKETGEYIMTRHRKEPTNYIQITLKPGTQKQTRCVVEASVL